jgi:hypothetical protein
MSSVVTREETLTRSVYTGFETASNCGLCWRHAGARRKRRAGTCGERIPPGVVIFIRASSSVKNVPSSAQPTDFVF